MDANKFWEIIESAWIQSGKNEARLKAIESNDSGVLEELMDFIEDNLIPYYQSALNGLSQEEFTSYLLKFEERLYHIDRQEIQEFTDGSDDGFLYCRCFIFAMGKEYYNMIDAHPSKASFDLEAEGFGFEGYSFFLKKFNVEFDRYTIHSIESVSNTEAWKGLFGGK